MGTFATIISHLCMTLFGLILLICVVRSQSCTKTGNCICDFGDGTKIDLTPLASSSGPAFDYKLPIDGSGDYMYAYNPCTGFTSGPNPGPCVNVAACQKNRDSTLYYNIGNPTAEFSSDGHTIQYTGADNKKTDVELVCVKTQTTPKYEVIGETSQGSNEYKIRLTTCHACEVEGCPKSSKGLSFGSILCILFTVLLFVYLVGGMIFNRYIRGASGKEVIPNVSLWEEFPLLVKDGFVFVASCCKSDTSYESI